LEDELASLKRLISEDLPGKLDRVLSLAGKESLTGKEAEYDVTGLIGQLQELLDVLEYDMAGEVARELETILGSERGPAIASQTKVMAYELLANTEMARFKIGRQSKDPGANTTKARYFLNKAKDAAKS
jgi:hypothetical protein